MVNDPVTACDPVKYAKLPSISLIVRAEPFTFLYINGIVFVGLNF